MPAPCGQSSLFSALLAGLRGLSAANRRLTWETPEKPRSRAQLFGRFCAWGMRRSFFPAGRTDAVPWACTQKKTRACEAQGKKRQGARLARRRRAAGRLNGPSGRNSPADMGNARKAKEQSSAFRAFSVRGGTFGPTFCVFMEVWRGLSPGGFSPRRREQEAGLLPARENRSRAWARTWKEPRACEARGRKRQGARIAHRRCRSRAWARTWERTTCVRDAGKKKTGCANCPAPAARLAHRRCAHRRCRSPAWACTRNQPRARLGAGTNRVRDLPTAGAEAQRGLAPGTSRVRARHSADTNTVRDLPGAAARLAHRRCARIFHMVWPPAGPGAYGTIKNEISNKKEGERMKGENLLPSFRERLMREEKSPRTVEQYVRAAGRFVSFLAGQGAAPGTCARI